MSPSMVSGEKPEPDLPRGRSRAPVLLPLLFSLVFSLFLPALVSAPGALAGVRSADGSGTLAAGALRAQIRSYRVEDFSATIRVREDGHLEVREDVRFRFDGSFNGVYRRIPVRYRGPGGLDYRIYLDVEGAFDESGSELRWEESREGDARRIQVWVPGAVDASRTISIRYEVVGGIRFFDEGEAEGFAEAHDELYWNVTGDDWDVPIGRASARVELPAGVAGLRARSYSGAYGYREGAAETQELEDGFQFFLPEGLSPGEDFTVVVGWESGVVERPGPWTRAWVLIRANWILLVPLLVFGIMGWLWHTRGRDPDLRSVAPWYEPPEGMTPAEIGTLVDDRPDTRDIVSTVVDLAVRGYLRIEEVERSTLTEIFAGAEYRFHRTRGAASWKELRAHERELLEGLFGTGGAESSVRLSELKNEFYKHLDEIRDGIFLGLMDRGFYQRRPDRVRKLYTGVGIGVIAAGTPAAVFLAQAVSISPVAAILAAVLSGLVVLGFGRIMPARTPRGARTLEEIRGFQEFLDRVEEDRFKRMITSPDQFEAYLPYAMALGVDATWARAFEDMVTEPPDWYVGSSIGHFRTTSFTESLGQMTARSGSVMTSAPRSSSGSSGFSGGGGSSGGGFGGGGGGAF